MFLGFLIGIYEFYDLWTGSLPQMKQAESLEEKKATSLESEVRKLQVFANNIQGIKQEFRELNLQLESALEHMPRTFNLASLLRKMTMLAQNSGIDISTFKPLKESVQRKQDSGDVNFYETIFANLSFQGTFTQTMVFFDQLSRLKRIVNIDSIKMFSRKDQGIKTAMALATTNIVIKTYRFSE